MFINVAAAASSAANSVSSSSLLATLLTSLVLVFGVFLWTFRAKYVPGVQAPGAIPIFGHTLQVLANLHRHHDHMNELALKAGDGKCFSLGLFQIGNRTRRTMNLGANEVLVKHILKDKFDNYVKGPIFYDALFDLLGNGIFNVDGDLWRRHRKIASWMFSLRNMQEDMLKVFLRNGDTVHKRLTEAANTQEVFDIQDIFFRYTVDSFCEIAFGVNPGALSAQVSFTYAFDTVQRIANSRFLDPIWRVKRFFQLGEEKLLTEQTKVMNDYAFDIIKKRRAQTRTVTGYEQLKANTDLLTRFLVEAEERQKEKMEEAKAEIADSSKTQQSPSHNHAKMDEVLTDEELRDIVLNFIIAGRDTTACLLSWTIYELTQHPTWEARLLSAVREKFAATGSYKDCGELAILRNFLHETLRLHPSVPVDMKCAVKDDILPDGTKVWAGDNIGYSPYLFGRSKRLWGEDVLEFKPERWEKENPSDYKFPQFNAGPRLCLGKRLALLEAGVLFSMLLNNFTFELAGHSKQQVTYALTVTMPVKDGLMVKVQARS